jgi:Glycosyl hydrolases family 28
MKMQLSMGLPIMGVLIIGLLGIATSHAQTTATPAISLSSGPYTWPQDTIIEDGTPGASIHWCWANSGTCTPSKSYNNQRIYIYPTAFPYRITICADAKASGHSQSAITCNYYTTWGYMDAPTGDSRTVSEPAFPSGCRVVNATKYSVWTNAVNIDPYNATAGSANGGTGTQGTLGATGGSDFEPSSSSSTYVSDETSDYTAINSALSSSTLTNSRCVELEQGSSGQSAFVITPFTIPANKTLVVDAGVTLYMSRNPSDYDNPKHTQYPCGTLISGSGGIDGQYCVPAITMGSASALMGHGRIDFRGWAQFPSNSTCVDSGSSTGAICSFYYNTIAAFLNWHSQQESQNYGMPKSPTTYNNALDGIFSSPPEAINIPSGANGVILYKITLLNAPGFGIQWAGSGSSCTTSGLTIWGVKLIDPFDTDNTDGFNPINGVCNFTVRDFYVSNGDDDSAIKAPANGSQTADGNYINVHKYAGLGMSIGSATGAGVSNIWYNHILCSGPTHNGAPSSSRDTCITVKSPDNDVTGEGNDAGTVSDVTYEGLYIQNEANGIWIYPYYYCPVEVGPTYTNFLFQDVTTGPSQGTLSFQSWSPSNLGTMKFNNFTITAAGHLPNPNTPVCVYETGDSGDEYGSFTVGPDPVDSRLVSQLGAGTGSSAPVGTPCTSDCVTPYSATPRPLVGELVMSDASGTNRPCTPTSPCSLIGSSYRLTLQATLQAGAEYDIMEAPQLSASGCPTSCRITFWDSIDGADPVSVGTATLGANGVTARLNVTITATGGHIFTASYAGDKNYAPYAWGAVEVTLYK